jgi:RimJ/RimL family protein N-acetyltransferase
VATVIVVWRLVTARLVMTPVAAGDLRDLAALKAHPRAFGQMLGGVRSWVQSVEELAEDIRAWGEFGFGMWAVRARDGGRFLRFAFWPKARGIGAAREAASAALFYAHDTAGLEQVVAVAREDNFASRTIIGSLGMVEIERFNRDGNSLLVYESFRQRTGG